MSWDLKLASEDENYDQVWQHEINLQDSRSKMKIESTKSRYGKGPFGKMVWKFWKHNLFSLFCLSEMSYPFISLNFCKIQSKEIETKHTLLIFSVNGR